MIDILRSLSPFPTINESKDLRDGFIVPQPSACIKCQSKSCVQLLKATSDKLVHKTCDFSYSIILIPTDYGNILINGILVPLLNTVMPSDMRKRNRTQKVSWEEIKTYVDKLTSSIPELNRLVQQASKELDAGFHDVKTAVNLVWRKAETVAQGFDGEDYGEKSAQAPDPLKGLLKAVDLLSSRLAMTSFLTNPDAAAYGNPHATPVYKVFHRMVRLFEEKAQSKNVRIRMHGSSSNSPNLYNSFETIPLVLIDNAVKYSHSATEISVKVNDVTGSTSACLVEVDSIGPLVQEEFQTAIFDRGIRAPNVKKIAAEGSGLGLYLAKIVAGAHGFQIEYTAQRHVTNAFSGTNIFSFVVESL